MDPLYVSKDVVVSHLDHQSESLDLPNEPNLEDIGLHLPLEVLTNIHFHPVFRAQRLLLFPKNPQKCEYYLPAVTNAAVQEGRASVRMLDCNEVWHGVTYQEDLQGVRDAIAALKQSGVYPEKLWEE